MVCLCSTDCKLQAALAAPSCLIAAHYNCHLPRQLTAQAQGSSLEPGHFREVQSCLPRDHYDYHHFLHPFAGEQQHDFDAKCRIVGKGFQERYDERIRRDSPTSSPFMQNIICSMCASDKLHLTVADVKGAFLRGKRIQRDLYFRLLKNLGDMGITDVEP